MSSKIITMPLNPAPIDNSYIRLIEFLMLSKHRIYELASQHGLTGMQAVTLCLLDQPKPMNSFGKIYNCDPANVTGIIDGLESKQLVTRFESPTDHRLKMVRLEPAGRKIQTQLLHELCDPKGYILGKLNSQEAEQFSKLIAKLLTE